MAERLITICADDEPLSRDRLARLLRERTELDVVAVCANAAEVQAALIDDSPDLLVLDIRMPGMSGVEVANSMRDHDGPTAQVVFVTAHAEPAVSAFDLGAVDYVLKPYSRARLDQAIDRVLERAEKINVQPPWTTVDRLPYRYNDRVQYIPFAELETITADGKSIIAGLRNGQELNINMSMKRAQELLPTPPFFRISRFSIVNLNYMQEMDELFNDTAEMHMRSGRMVHVSRRGRRQLRNCLER